MGRPPLRKKDGYALCRGISGESCSCEDRGQGPCDSLKILLRAAGCDVDAAIKMELCRIEMEIPATGD